MQRMIGVVSIRRLTIPAVFYLTYLPMILFPSFWVYLDQPGPFRDPYLVGVVSVLVTVPLGVLIANKVSGFTKREIEGYFVAHVDEMRPSVHQYVVHTLLVVAAIGIAMAYFSEVRSIPLLQMVTSPGDTHGLTIAREESFKLLDPRWSRESSTYMFYAYLFLRTLLFPLLILTTMGYYLHTRSARWLILFLAATLVGAFYAASSLSRAPISAIFMRIFFFLYLFNGGRLSYRVIVAFLVLMLSFPVLVTTFAHSSEFSYMDGLASIGKRLTYTPAEDLYYYFEVFPVDHDYLYGHSLVKPFLKLVGASYFYIENYVHLYISPLGVETGHANAAFVSNLHADGGLPAVLLGGVIIGILVQMLQIHLSRQRKTIFNVAVYSFVVYAIWALNFGSVTSVLFVNGLIPVFILIWVVRMSVDFFGVAVNPGSPLRPLALGRALTNGGHGG